MISWRKTKEYRLWRILVIRRDSVCQVCGSLKNREAHHLNHATYYPEQRFEIANGITLCKNCHMQFHTNFLRSFREKCTLVDYDNFKQLIAYIKGLT